jgi:hypothetical protein
MASFSAELRVAGRVYHLLRCTYSAYQATDARGRASAKVRHSPVELVLLAPRDNFLGAWGADPYKRCAIDIVYRDANGGQPLETLSMTGAYCVGYGQRFQEGGVSKDSQTVTPSSYVVYLTLTDPDGFRIQSGGGGTYTPPAAGTHGAPPIISTAALPPPDGTVSTCPPDVTAKLQLQVELMCNSKGVSSSCTKFDTCPALLEKIAIAESCIQARKTIMNQCFGGGDKIHKDQVENRERGVAKCRAIYERQCGPRTKPAPVPVPHREPSSEPVDHTPSPLIPVGLTGAALLIYLITSAFRPGPI